MNCRNQTKTMKQQKHELQTRTGRRTRRASAANCCAVPSLMLKPDNTPLARARRQGRGSALRTNEIVVVTTFMVSSWRLYRYAQQLCVFICCVMAGEGSLSCVPATYIPCRFLYPTTEHKTSTWSDSPPSRYSMRAYYAYR